MAKSQFGAIEHEQFRLVNYGARTNIAPMKLLSATIIVSPYQHVAGILDRTKVCHVISILGPSDQLEWPTVNTRAVLRLKFDDIIYSSGKFIAPKREQIADLIKFSRKWDGNGNLLVHCRAGSSRSPAAAMIAVAALARPDTEKLVMQVRTAKAYFRPNETMLRLSDALLGPHSQLAALARSLPAPPRTDAWGPAEIHFPPIGPQPPP